MSSSRREFLGKGAAAAGLFALAPGVRLIDLALAKPDDDPASGETRWGMLIDATQCTEGCDACVTACNNEHGLAGFDRPQTDAQWIRKLTLRDRQTGKVTSLPMLCQHCEDPPCVDVCPTGASFKRDDGIVLVNQHTCIGCRYCMMACPYKARSFVHETLGDQLPHAPRGKGVVESCTFCVHRVDRDRTPACAESCEAEGHSAMLFGDLNDPDSEISKRAQRVASRQVRADLGLSTAVRYEGV
ncbi:MAG: sulfate reduction electron transfer complex DsrMKJOP subunit DsrO [Gammaproteobacteria bacterium]